MKAHRTDVVSLAFGLVFVALAAWWLLAQVLGLALPPVGWFLAGGLILVGVLGLAGALRSGRGDRNTAGTRPPAEETVAVDLGDGRGTGAVDPGDGPGTGAGPSPADEWATSAATDGRPESVEEGPVSGGGGTPRWSAADPLDDEPTGPAGERVSWPSPGSTDPTAATPTVDPTAASTPDGPARGPGRVDG